MLTCKESWNLSSDETLIRWKSSGRNLIIEMEFPCWSCWSACLVLFQRRICKEKSHLHKIFLVSAISQSIQVWPLHAVLLQTRELGWNIILLKLCNGICWCLTWYNIEQNRSQNRKDKNHTDPIILFNYLPSISCKSVVCQEWRK